MMVITFAAGKRFGLTEMSRENQRRIKEQAERGKPLATSPQLPMGLHSAASVALLVKCLATGWRTGVKFVAGTRIFLLAITTSRPAMGLTQPPMQ
jgi:hypothetical protein